MTLPIIFLGVYMLKNNPGIYKITNTITNTVYIGQSSGISRRWQNHRSELIKNKHYCTYLQRAWNKYGHEAFICEAIEYIELDDLLELKAKLTEREYYWILDYKSKSISLYNVIAQPTMTRLGSTSPGVAEANKGAKNHEALLTEEQVICLLTDDSILSYKEAKLKYGVSKACIKDIWQRRSWQHLKYPKVIKEDEPAKRSGENHPFGQLKEVEAVAILTTDANLTVRECAEKYHTTRIVIEQLRARNTWKHLDLPAIYTKDNHKATGTTNGNSKLTEMDVKGIKLALSEGRSCCSIGKEYKVSNVTIANIRDGKIWKDIK